MKPVHGPSKRRGVKGLEPLLLEGEGNHGYLPGVGAGDLTEPAYGEEEVLEAVSGIILRDSTRSHRRPTRWHHSAVVQSCVAARSHRRPPFPAIACERVPPVPQVHSVCDPKIAPTLGLWSCLRPRLAATEHEQALLVLQCDAYPRLYVRDDGAGQAPVSLVVQEVPNGFRGAGAGDVAGDDDRVTGDDDEVRGSGGDEFIIL